MRAGRPSRRAHALRWQAAGTIHRPRAGHVYEAPNGFVSVSKWIN